MKTASFLTLVAAFAFAPTDAFATSIYCYGGTGAGTYADCHISDTACSSYMGITSD